MKPHKTIKVFVPNELCFIRVQPTLFTYFILFAKNPKLMNYSKDSLFVLFLNMPDNLLGMNPGVLNKPNVRIEAAANYSR